MNAIKQACIFLVSLGLGVCVADASATETTECVILLHGLARTDASMGKMGDDLKANGYRVINVDYPSRKETIEVLAVKYIDQAVERCRDSPVKRIHFVTHSMGGILIRYYQSKKPLEELGRVVMLSPPNQGSEVVDKVGKLPGFYALNGPAGQQLGTDVRSLPNQLGPVHYPVGVITGNKTINPVLSLLIPGEDDGKVAVERARLAGMSDFLVVPYTHTMIMRREKVIQQTRYFLWHGRFAEHVE